jgi:hypothetical protein
LNRFLGGNEEKADLGLLPGMYLFLGLGGALDVVIVTVDGIRGGVCIVSSRVSASAARTSRSRPGNLSLRLFGLEADMILNCKSDEMKSNSGYGFCRLCLRMMQR